MSSRERMAQLEAFLGRVFARATVLRAQRAAGNLSAAESEELADAERLLHAARTTPGDAPHTAASFDALARGDFRQSLLDPSEIAPPDGPAVEAGGDTRSIDKPLRRPRVGETLESRPRLVSDRPGDWSEEPDAELGGEFDPDFTGVRDVAFPSEPPDSSRISLQAPSMPIAPRAADALEMDLGPSLAPGLFTADLLPSAHPIFARDLVAEVLVSPERVEAQLVGSETAVGQGAPRPRVTTFGEALVASLLL